MFPPMDGALPQFAVDGPRMIQVLEFNPNEGEEGAPITVRIHFHSESSDPIHVRLVVGNKAVSTAVRELGGVEYGRWQLDAAAPALGHLATPDTKVLVTVQALNGENTILDSVPVGEFSYWECDGSRPKLSLDIKDNMHHSPTTGRRRAATHLPTPSPYFSMPSPSLSDRVPRSKTRQRRREVQRCIKDQSLMRARHHAPGEVDENLHAHTPVLELVTPLDSYAAVGTMQSFKLVGAWSASRRYRMGGGVISCIYREETEACYVTSVDIIYLLERLTNDEFPVEEKNRIRRNLEGLRPTTVSKHKPGSEAFFLRIMEFPDPKPRNIEKDLKVFDWTLLGQALDKIMSKYSIYTASPTDSTTSLPAESDMLQSPTLVPSHVNPTLVSKDLGGSLSEGLLFTSSHHYEDRSPLSPTHPLFPYGQDIVKQESDSSSGSWVSDHSFPKEPEAAFDVPEYEEAGGDDYGYDRYIRPNEMTSMPF
ncbi:hypothetical protein B0H17DRAFT_1207933 [Mycena rosella]|uniref:DUF7082 domain-containing protein n=1 Tax=Mycena rosella TaxID=1033263 RepID=A0AAD7GBV2_MYCRO|nr:hypothetical protein B0H17DRAFT_1207933 [Mycena rosella]